MKKTFILRLLAIITAFAFTSCDEDYTIVFPTWKGFRLNAESVKAGEVISITAEIGKPGKYLYGPDYSWTMDFDVEIEDADGEKKIVKETVGYSKKSTSSNQISVNDPAIGNFQVPKNAVKGKKLHKVTFSVDYKNSVDGKSESHTSEAEEGYLGGPFTYHVQSILFSNAKSKDFYVTFTVE